MDEEKKEPKEPKGYAPTDKFLNGLPKRFMTLQEWKDLPKKLREHYLRLELFEVKYD